MDKYLTKPVYFGNKDYKSINKLEDCFTQKEQIALLNAGLQRIKPTYLSVTDIKLTRKFKKTQNNCSKLNIETYRDAYKRYINRLNWDKNWQIARDVYTFIDSRGYQAEEVSDFDKEIEKARKLYEEKANKRVKIQPLEEFAMAQQVNSSYCVGGQA